MLYHLLEALEFQEEVSLDKNIYQHAYSFKRESRTRARNVISIRQIRYTVFTYVAIHKTYIKRILKGPWPPRDDRV